MTDYRRKAIAFYFRTGLVQLAVATLIYIDRANLITCFLTALLIGLSCLAIRIFVENAEMKGFNP